MQAFENTLKSWEDKLKYDKLPLRAHFYSQLSVDLATEEEVALVQLVARAADELITRYTHTHVTTSFCSILHCYLSFILNAVPVKSLCQSAVRTLPFDSPLQSQDL